MTSLAEHLGVVDPRTPEEPAAPYVEPKTAEEFAKRVLGSQDYRESLLRRALMGTLPAPVELWLLNSAYGKPTERVEHTGKNGGPIRIVKDLSDEELMQEAERFLQLAREATSTGAKS